MLIIDEVSMVPDDLLDKVSEYMSIVRKQVSRPFGGVQMIFVGDPCQLPPVNGQYFFKSAVWETMSPEHIQLTTIMRQEKDPEFRELLNRLRLGQCTSKDKKQLQACQSTAFDNWIQPTRLFALNSLVDEVNQIEFNRLTKNSNKLTQTYKTTFSNPKAESWAKSCGIPPSVELAEGAQVVVTYNINPGGGLINGTRGVITHLSNHQVVIRTTSGALMPIDFCELSNENDTTVIARFMPLKLAYAITIHKAQGMTLDAVELDLGSSIFEYGQAYTALSRAKDLKSVKINDVRARSFKTHPSVLQFYGKA
jgi:ATP-dependent DNA helicase PIF1